MRKILMILVLVALCHGEPDGCQELYNGFKRALDVLEDQITCLCETTVDGVYSFRFFLKDDNGIRDMNLVFDEERFHLYTDSEENPYECDKDKAMYRSQTPEEILKILFIPRRKYCSRKFRRSIGLN